MMYKFLTLLLLTACGAPQFSPWQTNSDYEDLTAKNLARIQGKSPERFKVALIADPQVVVGHMKKAVKRINNHGDIDLVLVLGDLTDRGLLTEFNIVADTLSKLHPPVLTVVGNHDGLNKGDKLYRSMFGPLDYQFDFGGFQFVAWNNNLYEWRNSGDYLSKVNTDKPVILFSHQPPYSGTLTDDIEDAWQDLRDEPNYKVSLHGHVHHFGYKQENDTHTYVTDRVDEGQYGVMEWTGSEFKFFNCTSVCTEVEQ